MKISEITAADIWRHIREKENRELEEKLVRYTLKRLLENIWHDVQNIPKQSARSF